jgi:hypothetical protein
VRLHFCVSHAYVVSRFHLHSMGCGAQGACSQLKLPYSALPIPMCLMALQRRVQLRFQWPLSHICARLPHDVDSNSTTRGACHLLQVHPDQPLPSCADCYVTTPLTQACPDGMDSTRSGCQAAIPFPCHHPPWCAQRAQPCM